MTTPKPNVTPEIDRLIADIEETGGRWYVLGRTDALNPRLVFELPANGALFGHAVEAMLLLDQHFRRDADIRRAVIDHAFFIRTAYIEVGT